MLSLLLEKIHQTISFTSYIDQALVPSKAEVLMNHFGSAPGMWLEKEGKVFVSLPGVPFEMRNLGVSFR